jgi:hypothetical protein
MLRFRPEEYKSYFRSPVASAEAILPDKQGANIQLDLQGRGVKVSNETYRFRIGSIRGHFHHGNEHRTLGIFYRLKKFLLDICSL